MKFSTFLSVVVLITVLVSGLFITCIYINISQIGLWSQWFRAYPEEDVEEDVEEEEEGGQRNSHIGIF